MYISLAMSLFLIHDHIHGPSGPSKTLYMSSILHSIYVLSLVWWPIAIIALKLYSWPSPLLVAKSLESKIDFMACVRWEIYNNRSIRVQSRIKPVLCQKKLYWLSVPADVHVCVWTNTVVWGLIAGFSISQILFSLFLQ